MIYFSSKLPVIRTDISFDESELRIQPVPAVGQSNPETWEATICGTRSFQSRGSLQHESQERCRLCLDVARRDNGCPYLYQPHLTPFAIGRDRQPESHRDERRIETNLVDREV